MMPVGLLGLGCALLSAAGVAILAAIDPKRRRGARRAARSATRRLLWLTVFLPGVALGIAGQWSDFLIWIGAAAVFGWGITALLSVRRRQGNEKNN
jgi:hypothetical protein